jgi:hypothetical protein
MGTKEFDAEREIESIQAQIRQQPQLSDKQLADVRTMCERIRSFCRSGKHEEARRTKALCMSVISQGSPVPE